jgi:hypothetical protein
MAERSFAVTVKEAEVEIIEEGIEEIAFEFADLEEEVFPPEGGRVKWFEDILGNQWVKFNYIDQEDRLLCMVIPCRRVMWVSYLKDEAA